MPVIFIFYYKDLRVCVYGTDPNWCEKVGNSACLYMNRNIQQGLWTPSDLQCRLKGNHHAVPERHLQLKRDFISDAYAVL